MVTCSTYPRKEIKHTQTQGIIKCRPSNPNTRSLRGLFTWYEPLIPPAHVPITNTFSCNKYVLLIWYAPHRVLRF